MSRSYNSRQRTLGTDHPDTKSVKTSLDFMLAAIIDPFEPLKSKEPVPLGE